MALAKYHSERGEKSALLLVKANKFQFVPSCAYVPREAVADHEVGDEFYIPDGYSLAPMVGEDGEVRTTKDGEPLHTLIWE